MIGYLGRLVLILTLAVPACTPDRATNYLARPAAPAAGDTDRIHVERGGVRVVAGPPAAFPYVQRFGEDEDDSSDTGRYQLYTRVRVENGTGSPIEVLWHRARLLAGDGSAIELIDSRHAAALARGAEPAPPAAERVGAGRVALRALLPARFREMETDDPLVELCDGCVYRLRLPVRVDGREEVFELPFRLEAEQPSAGFDFLFWEDIEF